MVRSLTRAALFASTIAGFGTRGGYSTVDVSDPTNPTLLHNVLTSETPVTSPGRDFASNGAGIGLLVGGPIGSVPTVLDVFDTTAPPATDSQGNPVLDPDALLTRFVLPAQPQAVEIGSGVAFVADGTTGLVVANYKPFDTGGDPPTLTIETGVDSLPGTPGIQVEEGNFVSAVRIAFMRIEGDRLKTSDTYLSEWIGTPTSGAKSKTLNAQGARILGIYGRQTAMVDAVGLVFDDS